MNTLATELFDEICRIPCINSHSHMMPEPQGARHDLKEWLRMVPSNKIIAFGDDVMHVEVVYGHLKMARQNFAIVLAELIEEGLLSQAASLEVAQAAFHDTPAAVYGVQP